MATDVSETTFDHEVIEGSKETPVLVDFWAEWCGPCHAVSPVLEKIAAEREGDLKLVKVNIDENQNLAGRYGVMSIPTMILFKDGAPVKRIVGAKGKAALLRELADVV
jgi:thioredoxin